MIAMWFKFAVRSLSRVWSSGICRTERNEHIIHKIRGHLSETVNKSLDGGVKIVALSRAQADRPRNPV